MKLPLLYNGKDRLILKLSAYVHVMGYHQCITKSCLLKLEKVVHVLVTKFILITGKFYGIWYESSGHH